MNTITPKTILIYLKTIPLQPRALRQPHQPCPIYTPARHTSFVPHHKPSPVPLFLVEVRYFGAIGVYFLIFLHKIMFLFLPYRALLLDHQICAVIY